MTDPIERQPSPLPTPGDDEYLWSRAGSPPPDVARLEQTLAPLRYEQRTLPECPGAAPRQWSFKWIPLAAAALLVLATGATIASHFLTAPSLKVQTVAGSPSICDKTMANVAHIKPGQWLTTDAVSTALIEVADHGHVTVQPYSKVRLVESSPGRQQLEMKQGRIHAVIAAPPRLFVVTTPAAEAVDLGCAYTLDVAADGGSMLEVSAGSVSLERGDRVSTVPAEAYCRTHPQQGPGTPCFSDAAQSLRSALDRFDFDGASDADLAAILDGSRPRDSLTLWHLIARADADQRGRVYDRLLELAPPPQGVTREGILALDEQQLGIWWSMLDLKW